MSLKKTLLFTQSSKEERKRPRMEEQREEEEDQLGNQDPFLQPAEDDEEKWEQHYREEDNFDPIEELQEDIPDISIKEADECDLIEIKTNAKKGEVWKFTVEHKVKNESERQTFLAIIIWNHPGESMTLSFLCGTPTLKHYVQKELPFELPNCRAKIIGAQKIE